VTDYDRILKLIDECEPPTHMVAQSVAHAMLVHELYGSEVVILRDGEPIEVIPERK
jgi:ABC-type glutathione transport system ATPase component